MTPFVLHAYRTTVENGVRYTRRLGTKGYALCEEMYVTDLLKFLKVSCCPDQKNRCPLCMEAYDYRNLPRGFKVHFDPDTNEFWHSNSTSTQKKAASVYVDGGSVATNKLPEGTKITIYEGAMIYIRPDLNQRNKLINMEFRVAVGMPTVNLNRLQEARESAKRTMDIQELQRKTAANAIASMKKEKLETKSAASNAIDLTQPTVKVKQEPADSPVNSPIAFATEVGSSPTFSHDKIIQNDPPSSPFVNSNVAGGGRDPPGSSPLFRSPKGKLTGVARLKKRDKEKLE